MGNGNSPRSIFAEERRRCPARLTDQGIHRGAEESLGVSGPRVACDPDIEAGKAEGACGWLLPDIEAIRIAR